MYIFCTSQQIHPLSAASLHGLHFFRGKPRNGRFCGSSISTTFSLNANREISGKAKSGVMSVKISRVVRTLLKISKQVHRIYCVGRNYWDHGVRLKPLHLLILPFSLSDRDGWKSRTGATLLLHEAGRLGLFGNRIR